VKRKTKKTLKNKRRIHVVAAVIEDTNHQILIAKRPKHAHQGGLWEFPGGKVEANELPEQALKRELFEELGIRVQACEPLIQISYDYPDKSIFLDVWRVTHFTGQAYGKESQQTCWVNKNELTQYQFPAANNAILSAAILPQYYLITPEPDLNYRKLFLARIEKKVKSGFKLIQLRAKNLSPSQLNDLYQDAQQITQAHDATLLVNSSIAFAEKIGADGVHLSASTLLSTTKLPDHLICAASCHTEQEIFSANQLSLNFMVLSPVLKTASHPLALPLTWHQFSDFCQLATVPVYALGGMKVEHLAKAKRYGAQGISAIRSFWQE